MLWRLICHVNSINWFFSLVERSTREVQISQAKHFFSCLSWVKCSARDCLSNVQLQHVHLDVLRWFSPSFAWQLFYISLSLGSVNEMLSLRTCIMFNWGDIYDWVRAKLVFRDYDKTGKQYHNVLVQASFAMLCPWLIILQLRVAEVYSVPFACREDFELPGIWCEIFPWLKALCKIHAPFKFFMH